MSEKIRRSAMAFARRVMIGENRIWLIVEGRTSDIYLYDKIVGSSRAISDAGYDFRQIEDIEVDGRNAGGKSAALAAFDYFRKRSLLRQSNLGRDKVIVFLLDKDLDDLTGRARRSPHVIYTHHADVEAEVFAHADFPDALGAALSLSGREAKALADFIGHPLRSLALRWMKWIELGVVASFARARGASKFGGRSEINDSTYGSVDEDEFNAVLDQIRGGLGFSTKGEQWIYSRFNRAVSRDQICRHVKGKHVPGLIEELAKSHLSERNVRWKGFRTRLEGAALQSIQFDEEWTRHWTNRIESLIIPQKEAQVRVGGS